MISQDFIDNPPFPTFTQFETGTACNARCRMCPHPSMKRKGTAKWSTIAKVIREAAPKSGAMCPFLMQEPMLEPRLFDILANIKQNNQWCGTVVYSNMGKWHPQLERVLRYNLLDELHISFYGPTPELHAKWQPGLNYKTVVRNIRRIKRLRKQLQKRKPLIILHVLNVPEILGAISKYEVASDVDQVAIVQYDTFHGDVPDYGGDQSKVMGNPQPRTPCQRLWTGLNVHFDGTVVPCCIDWRDQHPLGNVNKQSLQEIWTGANMKGFRWLHTQGRWGEIDMCRECRVHEYQFSREWNVFWQEKRNLCLTVTS